LSYKDQNENSEFYLIREREPVKLNSEMCEHLRTWVSVLQQH